MKNSTFRKAKPESTATSRHSAEWPESARTTLMMPLRERREWALNRAVQLQDYERRRSPVTDHPTAAVQPVEWARMLRLAA
jgi:hypothetical protein